MANLFALRTTNPQGLYSDKNPVGSENDYYIKKIRKEIREDYRLLGESWSFQ